MLSILKRQITNMNQQSIRAKKDASYLATAVYSALILSLVSCTTVPVVYDNSGTKRVDFAAVVSTFPEYSIGPLPQAITPITQQNIANENERLRNVARFGPKPAPNSDQAYRVGAGDILNIVVWDHPELSFNDIEGSSSEPKGSVVSASGTIFYPYVGVVRVVDLTVEQIREKLTNQLAVTIENPQLEVRVAEYRSKKAFVGGELLKPGMQKITDVPLTLIDAITSAGGATALADLGNATLKRQEKEFKLNLNELFVHGGGELNITLVHGDVLTIPSLNDSKYFVLGQVEKPIHKEITNREIKLSEAVLAAGGVKRAKDEPIHNSLHIFIIRNAGNEALVFHLDRAASDSLILSDNFNIIANDIVFVSSERPANWNLVYQQILHYSNLAKKQS